MSKDSARPAPAAASVAVVGYASVNYVGEGYSTHDLQRQVHEITVACERSGLRLMRVAHDHVSPQARPLERPGLTYALGRIKAGEARGLVVCELSRLARALPDLGRVLEWLTCRDARFIAAWPQIDTGDAAGRLTVRTIIEVSRWERQRLVEGTRAGMRAARRKGPASVTDYPELRERIAEMRAGGMTLQAIADQLNAGRVPTIRGGAKWRPSSVQAAAGYHRPSARQSADRRPGGAAGTDLNATDL
jgi:DNA invertase Pin-like site-specific DNA recombinase